jgi:hypothetical protein
MGWVFRHFNCHGHLHLWTGRDLEGSSRSLIEIIILAFGWRDWGKPRRTSVRIIGVSAKIWTKHLLSSRAFPLQQAAWYSIWLNFIPIFVKMACSLNILGTSGVKPFKFHFRIKCEELGHVPTENRTQPQGCRCFRCDPPIFYWASVALSAFEGSGLLCVCAPCTA